MQQDVESRVLCSRHSHPTEILTIYPALLVHTALHYESFPLLVVVRLEVVVAPVVVNGTSRHRRPVTLEVVLYRDPDLDIPDRNSDHTHSRTHNCRSRGVPPRHNIVHRN